MSMQIMIQILCVNFVGTFMSESKILVNCENYWGFKNSPNST